MKMIAVAKLLKTVLNGSELDQKPKGSGAGK